MNGKIKGSIKISLNSTWYIDVNNNAWKMHSDAVHKRNRWIQLIFNIETSIWKYLQHSKQAYWTTESDTVFREVTFLYSNAVIELDGLQSNESWYQTNYNTCT